MSFLRDSNDDDSNNHDDVDDDDDEVGLSEDVYNNLPLAGQARWS